MRGLIILASLALLAVATGQVGRIINPVNGPNRMLVGSHHLGPMGIPGGRGPHHGSTHLPSEPVVGIERPIGSVGSPVVSTVSSPMTGYVPKLPVIREEIIEDILFEDDFNLWEVEEDIEIFLNAFVEGAFQFNPDEELIGCLTNPEWFM